MKPAPLKESDGCHAVMEILNRVGDRWSMSIVRRLRRKTMRFNELRRSLHGISQKVLTMTLRSLERDGFVARRVIPTKPPRVDYELTELGRDLWKSVAALGDWAKTNHAAVKVARKAFDERKGAAR